jgi:hypothetical protein
MGRNCCSFLNEDGLKEVPIIHLHVPSVRFYPLPVEGVGDGTWLPRYAKPLGKVLQDKGGLVRCISVGNSFDQNVSVIVL